ncbi:hypothetical protein ABZ477_11050 [Microbacterium sp. NPDC019599]|uniref:hypothetical protein n=1 Tax=Microbacterium sp. NPDC019599 TaxID=3154690 RepID=UPI0033C4B8F1
MRELIINTLNGTVGLPERWLPFVARELQDPDGFITVSDGRKNSYAQAFNLDGMLLLEYRDRSPRRHFQVTGVGVADVAHALEQWSAGERAFIARHDWTRVTDWDDQASG